MERIERLPAQQPTRRAEPALFENAVPFELAHEALVDQVFRFELGEFSIDAAEDAHRVAHALDSRKNAPAIERAHRFLSGHRVIDLRQAQPLHTDTYNVLFLL